MHMQTRNLGARILVSGALLTLLGIWLVMIWPFDRAISWKPVGGSTAQSQGHEFAMDPPLRGPLMDPTLEGPFDEEALATLRGDVIKASDYELSGPYTHNNLAIFLIHGSDTLPGKTYLTLQEALEQKKVVVHETGNVNQLAVESLSPTEEIYIHSGDIVKGGRQDRMLQYDLPLSPQSGQVPLASFCVERGRWSQRGSESSTKFEHSAHNASSKDFKLAGYYHQSQSEVWDKVAKTQEQLYRNVGETVADSRSTSSLELSLENTKVQEAVQGYLNKISPALDGKKNVIGYAVVINAKVSSADIYASGNLFKKLWPRLLKASAVEALAEKQDEGTILPIGAETVKEFLLSPESAKTYKRSISNQIHVLQQETDQGLLFDMCDTRQKNLVIHRSYVAK